MVELERQVIRVGETQFEITTQRTPATLVIEGNNITIRITEQGLVVLSDGWTATPSKERGQNYYNLTR